MVHLVEIVAFTDLHVVQPVFTLGRNLFCRSRVSDVDAGPPEEALLLADFGLTSSGGLSWLAMVWR